MSAFRSLTSVAILLCVQLLACHLGSSASVSSSLWGKKIQLSGRPCMWQLQPGVLPALKELSVCTLFRLNFATKWTGFVYKALGQRRAELGLQGTHSHLSVWLFGEEQVLKTELQLHEWYSVCLTWSGQAKRLRVYINGSSHSEISVNATLPTQLAESGTLTLGMSHYMNAFGEVKPEGGNNLLGDIGLFRMWAREWSAEEMMEQSCADGDVVSWDAKQWKYSCPPVPDSSLHCAWSLYKITMWTFVLDSVGSEKCSLLLEEVMTKWLETIFQGHVSLHDISVSSPSRACGVNNSAPLQVKLTQGSRTLLYSTYDECFSCEVYVKVDPAADIGVVQANITALLSLEFSYKFCSLKSDPHSISILPMELFPAATEPLLTTNTGATQSVLSDRFFKVNMTLSVTGRPTNPQDMIETWVKEQLGVNDTMVVLNFILKENTGRNVEQQNKIMIFHSKHQQYLCAFHVQEYNVNSVAETEAMIESALTSKYENGSVTIESINVAIKHIEPEDCLEETLSTIYGEYIWPETFPQVNQVMGCKEPTSERAYRLCKLHIENDTTSWTQPDMTNCNPVVFIADLDNITVTTDNGAEVVDMIQDLVKEQLDSSEELSASDLHKVVDKLTEVVDISIVTLHVGTNIVKIVSDILLSKTDVTHVADVVLNLTESMGDIMDFEDESVSITAPLLALAMINVVPDEFAGLTFGVSSVPSNLTPKIFLNQSFASSPAPDTDATISLPSELRDFFLPGQGNETRVQFNYHGTQKLFQEDLKNATQSSRTLNSYIVSASINNSLVSNLLEGVFVTFKHLTPKHPEDKVHCVFWDFQINGGQGGWNSKGCEIQSVSPSRSTCRCTHLTHFAVLLEVSRGIISETDSQILTVISYLGCGISSIFLGITLLTYLAFPKLRRDYPSKILINLSAALLGLCMLFLLDSWLSSFSNYGLCIATAATLHYFMLASFTWMGLEAVHMYLALVKVFNVYVPFYMLKFCALGWGIPLVIVSLVLAINKDAYGNALPVEAAVELGSTEQFCYLQNDVYFYVTVVAFILLVLLCNISVFVVVLLQIRKMRTNKPSANGHSSLHDLRAVASLTVLLGLTWVMGFFSFGPGRVVLLYLFTIFNTLQGLFIFVFHCLMKENVRKQWRMHLCCGRFRLSIYSDGTRTTTVSGPGKKNNVVNADSVTSDITSTIKDVSDTSTFSPPNHQHEA